MRPGDIYEAQLLNLFTQGISALKKTVTAQVKHTHFYVFYRANELLTRHSLFTPLCRVDK